jgi:hypothetical protein
MIGRIKAHASPNSLIFLHNVKTMHIQSLRRLLTVPVALLERTQHGGLFVSVRFRGGRRESL